MHKLTVNKLFGPPFFVLLILCAEFPSKSLAKDEIVISSDMKTVSGGNLRGTNFILDIPTAYTAPMTEFFSRMGTGSPIKLSGCHSMIDINSVGISYGHDGYENGFGAYCFVHHSGAKEEMAVCADDMVGNFKIAPAPNPSTKGDLVKFVIRNCIGG